MVLPEKPTGVKYVGSAPFLSVPQPYPVIINDLFDLWCIIPLKKTLNRTNCLIHRVQGTGSSVQLSGSTWYRTYYRENWQRKTSICRKIAASLHTGMYRLFYVSLTTGHVTDKYKSIAWEMGLTTDRCLAALFLSIRQEV